MSCSGTGGAICCSVNCVKFAAGEGFCNSAICIRNFSISRVKVSMSGLGGGAAASLGGTIGGAIGLNGGACCCC